MNYIDKSFLHVVVVDKVMNDMFADKIPCFRTYNYIGIHTIYIPLEFNIICIDLRDF